MHGHDVIDRTSLELARAIAAKIDADPSLLRIPQDNLRRWMQRNSHAPSLMACYTEWQNTLERGWSQVRAVLLDPSDEGQRLRQNSPFPGVLSPKEVWDIKRRCANDA
jgi:hypothetical protein